MKAPQLSLSSRRVVLTLCALAAVGLTAVTPALATPLTFNNINVSSGNQSRIDIDPGGTIATIAGNPVNGSPQFTSGGLNGDGSASTLYNQTGSNTPSNMEVNLHTNSIVFPGGGTAMAANATGLFGNNLAIQPAAGGGTGSGAADYGLVFSSPQMVAIPPIDISSLNIPGITSLNLGTLTSINLNVALRDFVLDLNSGTIPVSPVAGYPATFDASQVDLIASGTADMSLTATLTQGSLADWLATGAALIALNSALSGQGINITSTGNLLGLSYQVGIGFTTPLPATTLPNTGAGSGTIEHVGSNLRLTLPVSFDLASALPSPLDTLLTANIAMTGQLIGQTPYVVVNVPEPSSVILALTGMTALGCVARRRRVKR